MPASAFGGPAGPPGPAGPGNVLVGKPVDAVGTGDTGKALVYNNATGHWEPVDVATQVELAAAVAGLYNVKDYGAHGDGVTDDTTAIQAAITAAGSATYGGVVSVKPGVYLLTASLTVPANVAIVGFGNRLSLLKRAGAYGSVISVANDNVTLQDFAIDGGLSSFATNANHGVSVQNSNNFRARRIHLTNWQNSAILCQGTPAQTYRDNVIEDCTCDGGGAANNGFLIVNLDESGIRSCKARGIPGNPGYGAQLKNNCRWSFIEDCEAVSCTGGLVCGHDTAPGVLGSRITGGNIYACDGGLLLGDAINNVVTGVNIYMTTNVNDAVRLQQGSTNNVITGVVVHGVGASRSAVRFDDTSTDNVVTLDLLDAACATTAAFTVSADRNLVEVKKYGTSTPTHEVSSSSTGVANRVRRADDRRSLMEAALGEITGTYDRSLPTVAGLPTSQLPYYVPVYLRAGEVISNISLHVSAFTTGATNFYVGLYSAAGARLAVSADSAGSIASTGQKTIALSASYTVLDSGLYYVGILNNGGNFQFLRQASSTAAKVGAGSFPYAQDTNAASTTLPTTASMAAGTSAFWAALS